MFLFLSSILGQQQREQGAAGERQDEDVVAPHQPPRGRVRQPDGERRRAVHQVLLRQPAFFVLFRNGRSGGDTVQIV